MTTPDHDFLGWSTDASLSPAWEAPAEWVQPSTPERSVPPKQAPSPPRKAPVPERPRPTRTPPPQPHRSVGGQLAAAPPPPDRTAATRSESSDGSRRSSGFTGGLARATLGSVVLAGFMIVRVIGSGGFRNGLLALVLSIIAVALVAATVLRARNVP